MDVDELIKEPNSYEQQILETQEIFEALVTQEPKIFEEEIVTLHYADYNISSKNLLIEKVNMKNKKMYKKWKLDIDFNGVAPSKIVQFYETTREALKEFVGNIEKENLILKEKIKKLEVSLIPRPFFIGPLNMVQQALTLEDIPERNNKWKGSSSLLLEIRKYVEDRIQKIIDLIKEI
jgi:predicted transcriptional regulator